MGFEQSKEMFINMSPKDIPFWDSNKHYFEQSLDALQFWEEERKKILYGFNIGGYFVHPWLYYHLNFFHTPIPTVDNMGVLRDIIKNPPLDDNIFYVIESYKEAQEKNKILFLFGTRGATKSTYLSSHQGLTQLTKNGRYSIIGQNDKDLKELTSLIQQNHFNAIPPLYLPTITADWDKHVEFGFKDKKNKRVLHGELDVSNAGTSVTKKSEKGAGGNPIGFVMDEVGKGDFLNILTSAIPSFKTAYGFRLVPILSGTGGNAFLSKDAKRVLSNPQNYDVLPINYDLLRSIVPEEHITWGETKKFGTFMPAQMTYREQTPRYDDTFANYLGKKDKYLEKINIRRIDWGATNEMLVNLIEKNSDLDLGNRNRMYYPRDIDDCFLTIGENPFPKDGITARIIELEQDMSHESSIEIYANNGKMKYSFSSKKKAELDYSGGVVDSPILLFDAFPEEKPLPHTYVSGLDDYKIDAATESLSHGAYYILKRRGLAMNEPSERVVACLVSRPDKHIDFYRSIENMQDTWNSKCLIEAIDVGYKNYLDIKNRTHDLLHPAVSYSMSAQNGRFSGKGYGMFPTKENNEYRITLAVDYTREKYNLGIDESGNEVIKYGYEFIDDIDLLKEMRDYKKGKNCDRIDGFSYALVLSRELDNRKVFPRTKSRLDWLSDDENFNKPKKKKVVIDAYGFSNRIKKY